MIAVSLGNKLMEWLDATTSYSNEPKDDLNRKPNHQGTPKWRRFYQFGPMLVMDNSSVLDVDGKPTGLRLDVKAVAYDRNVTPGEIITSGNGRRYMVQTNGSLRKV